MYLELKIRKFRRGLPRAKIRKFQRGVSRAKIRKFQRGVSRAKNYGDLKLRDWDFGLAAMPIF